MSVNENRIDKAVQEGILFLEQNPDMRLIFIRDSERVYPIAGTDAPVLANEVARWTKFEPKLRNAALSNLFTCAKSTDRRVDITEAGDGHTIVIGPANRTLAFDNV